MSGEILADRLYTGGKVLQNQVISFGDGVVTSVKPVGSSFSGKAYPCMSAGFIDIHINGGEKFHFTKDPSEEALADMETACRESGTAYLLPALITSPYQNMMKGIDAVRRYRAQCPSSAILGLHLEGPYISRIKRGAHPEQYIRTPSIEELQELSEYGRDVVRMLTIAPELFGDKEMDFLLSSGITISGGHSNATYQEASRAFDLGISLVTHLFNAMSSFEHRNPGLTGAALERDEVRCPIIPDGHHCDFAAARLAYKVKRDKLFLISDALFLNRKMKNFKWETFDARLENDTYVNSEGRLAGSAISLGEAVRNSVQQMAVPLPEAIEMVTRRPAQALGLDDQFGAIAPGYPAVFTAFDESLSKFAVLTF